MVNFAETKKGFHFNSSVMNRTSNKMNMKINTENKINYKATENNTRYIE